MAPRLGDREWQRRRRQGQCFRCGNQGHMARHKDVCPAWAEKVAAKAAEAERQDIVESDTKDIKKKPGPQRWPNYWRCIRYNECFRCEQKGHRWYHFGLCPLKAPSRYVVDYRITLLRPMTISFLDLPPELRDMIYRDACDWNHAVSGYSRLLSNHERMLEANPRKYKDTYVPLRQPLHTPTVLLLNRQIFSEAFEILKKTPLVLRCTSDESELIQQLVRLRSVISLFGTEHMLSRIPVIEIVVDREWFFDGMCFIKHLAYDCLDDDQPKYNHFIVTLDDSVYPDAMATHETFDVHELSLFEMLHRAPNVKRITLRSKNNDIPHDIGYGMSWMPSPNRLGGTVVVDKIEGYSSWW